jgi:hypothetical protein
MVGVLDCTFFGRGYGILVCRDPNRKKNVHWFEVDTENPNLYLRAKTEMAAKGITIVAVVLDGKAGVRDIFKDMPVQMCQFHQIQIVRRYLTTRPKLEAGKDLRLITLALPTVTEQLFTELLNLWYERWEQFLKEKTISEDGKHWHYTHKRIRSAYRSLNTNLPYLFTYQKYPQLNIPNTTNSLDGYFSRVKNLLSAHRGLSKQKRYLLINEILTN